MADIRFLCQKGHECDFELDIKSGKPAKLKVRCPVCKVKEDHVVPEDIAREMGSEVLRSHFTSDLFTAANRRSFRYRDKVVKDGS